MARRWIKGGAGSFRGIFLKHNSVKNLFRNYQGIGEFRQEFYITPFYWCWIMYLKQNTLQIPLSPWKENQTWLFRTTCGDSCVLQKHRLPGDGEGQRDECLRTITAGPSISLLLNKHQGDNVLSKALTPSGVNEMLVADAGHPRQKHDTRTCEDYKMWVHRALPLTRRRWNALGTCLPSWAQQSDHLRAAGPLSLLISGHCSQFLPFPLPGIRYSNLSSTHSNWSLLNFFLVSDPTTAFHSPGCFRGCGCFTDAYFKTTESKKINKKAKDLGERPFALRLKNDCIKLNLDYLLVHLVFCLMFRACGVLLGFVLGTGMCKTHYPELCWARRWAGPDPQHPLEIMVW